MTVCTVAVWWRCAVLSSRLLKDVDWLPVFLVSHTNRNELTVLGIFWQSSNSIKLSMWPSDFCMQSWCLVGRVCLLFRHDSTWNSITRRRTPFRCLSNWQVKENCPLDKTALHRRSKLDVGGSALSLADRSVCSAGRRRTAVTVTRVKICVHYEHLNVCVCRCPWPKWANEPLCRLQ